ncbi:DUF948 domain-containing protein [Thermodesulfatator atlanticus]|uniref:DUF948 domain-containing protein n=1 Tax=Thermodesulfatator atlanticus TaxID=501497 RepID=UPI0003B65550|nr:DUF948 domain-containing protein [Thermodesulfatator atlanticus]
MDWHEGLYLAGIVAAAFFVVLVIFLLSFIGRLKQTLDNLDRSLSDTLAILRDLELEVKPVLSSANQTLDNASALAKRIDSLAEEVSVLPPAVKEILKTFNEIFTDLSDELRETLKKVNALLDETTGRMQREVPEVLEEVDKLIQQLNGIVEDIKAKIDKTEQLFEAVEETGRATKVIAEVISKNVAEAAIEVAAVAKGLQVALKTFKKRLPGGEIA